MLCEWDDDKDLANQKKHGLAFADAVSVFDDPGLLSRFDEPHSLDEDRWVSLGRSDIGILCVVSHTFRDRDDEEYARIISARPATKNEELQYYSR